ncbi:hypothetical protein Enr13x_37940 [Stieleria neptunia]|uniref:Uncharacterized protein n=1 Tax=Stieleria neptunia TaxID=2527979 RepID=A0A518HSZ7_9BACT|nr:hypothetical protein Enr13x_37940 [Stieleria neptunia]
MPCSAGQHGSPLACSFDSDPTYTESRTQIETAIRVLTTLNLVIRTTSARHFKLSIPGSIANQLATCHANPSGVIAPNQSTCTGNRIPILIINRASCCLHRCLGFRGEKRYSPRRGSQVRWSSPNPLLGSILRGEFGVHFFTNRAEPDQCLNKLTQDSIEPSTHPIILNESFPSSNNFMFC